MLALEVDKVGKTYGRGEDALVAISELSFSVSAGEFVCVVGPSGCGKTTLLKCISGLLAPTKGRALLEGKPVSGPPDGLALVFQDYSRSLMPWLRISSNVTLPLRARGVSRRERDAAARRALAAVGLEDTAGMYPWQLSGGMQQRVAIARALAYSPRLLLMDEPFASVDAQTRADLEDLVASVHAEMGITIVFVTHDIDESVYLADRVVVLTRRPTCVREIVEVDIPRPRDQVLTRELPAFGRLRGHVARLVRSAPDEPGRPDAMGDVVDGVFGEGVVGGRAGK